MTRRAAPAALAGAALLAAGGVAVAAVPDAGTYRGSTAQGLDVRVKVNSKHRVKRFRIDWWAPCDRAESSWASAGNPDGTVIRDVKGDPISQTDDGALEGSGKYKGDTDDNGYRGHFRVSFSGKFGDRTHANGKFTIKVRVTKDGVTYDHCRKTVKWHVGD